MSAIQHEETFTTVNNNATMLYMIIETFHPGKIHEVYKRFDENGRLQPAGLTYINSWIDTEVKKCYQVMECANPDLLNEWINNWKDLVDFDIIPVLTSAQARQKVLEQ